MNSQPYKFLQLLSSLYRVVLFHKCLINFYQMLSLNDIDFCEGIVIGIWRINA